MEDLQKQLERERERREKAAEELNEKRRELDDEQRKLLQQQIDDQNNRYGQLYLGAELPRVFEGARDFPSLSRESDDLKSLSSNTTLLAACFSQVSPFVTKKFINDKLVFALNFQLY